MKAEDFTIEERIALIELKPYLDRGYGDKERPYWKQAAELYNRRSSEHMSPGCPRCRGTILRDLNRFIQIWTT